MLRQVPRSGTLWANAASVDGQLGAWASATEKMVKAVRLSPRDKRVTEAALRLQKLVAPEDASLEQQISDALIRAATRGRGR